MRHAVTLKLDIIPVNPRAVYNQAMEILTLNAIQSRPYFDQIVTIYQAAFSQPPYNETLPDMLNFAARLPYHAVNHGFRCAVARPSPHAEIAGVAYGYAGLPRTWWYGLVAPALSAEKAEFWLGETSRILAAHPNDAGLTMGAAMMLDAPAGGYGKRYVKYQEGPAWLPVIPRFDYPALQRVPAQRAHSLVETAGRLADDDHRSDDPLIAEHGH